MSVAFSPDGKTLVTGSGDKTARLWDAATGQPLGRPSSTRGGVSSVAFSPDGKTRPDRQRRQHGAALGRRHRPAHRRAPARHTGTGQGVAFSPDGKTVLTGS